MANDDAAAIEQLQAELRRVCSENAALRLREATLVGDAERREHELSEAREQQAATSEILRVIASSPADMTGALQTIAETAKRLCSPTAAGIRLVDGDGYFFVAATDPDRWPVPVGLSRPIAARAPSGEAIRGRRTVHTADVTAPETLSRYPDTAFGGQRTTLNVPLVRDGESIGLITLSRFEVQPYTEDEIALIETFADQAVIAIENARLFQRLEQRNAELTQALDQQTSTSEILRVIASSPMDLHNVLDALVASAARLCQADHANTTRLDGDEVVVLASTNPEYLGLRYRLTGTVVERMLAEERTIHVHGSREEQLAHFPESPSAQRGVGAQLNTPLLRGGQAIGMLGLTRYDPRPFSDSEIGLLESFADQAVIAIENARLFEELEQRNRELNETLEQQTATAEVLRVIASSPTDLQTVMDTVAANAARLCGSDHVMIAGLEGDSFRLLAAYGPMMHRLWGLPTPATRQTIAGLAVLERRTVQVDDIRAAFDGFPGARPLHEQTGARTIVAVPMLHESFPIGAIVVG